MYYLISSASTHKPRVNRHEYVFWTLGRAMRIISPYSFSKGDLVEITGIDTITEAGGGSIRIAPARIDPETVSLEDKRLLTVLSNAIPVAAESDYRISSDTSEILLVNECEYQGNKKYAIVAGLRLDCTNRVHGTDCASGDRFEIQVDAFFQRAKVDNGLVPTV